MAYPGDSAFAPPPPPAPPSPPAGPGGTPWWRTPLALFLFGLIIAAAIAVPIVFFVLGGDDENVAATTTSRPTTTTAGSSTTGGSSTTSSTTTSSTTTSSTTTSSTTSSTTTSSTTSTTVPPEELDWTLDPNFGEDFLITGFLPDPYAVAVISGGPIDASYLGEPDCRGYATAAPDFELFWDGDGGLLRFFFVADTPGEDAVLIVNGPAGGWFCNDDFDYPDIRDPMLDFPTALEGTYDIWVASYSAGETVAGTLYITEVAANTP